MFGTMELQIKYLLLLQHFRELTHGVFDGFFMIMTWFGEFFIPISFVAILYWCFNKRAGTFLLFSVGLTLWVNVFLKMTACVKRPWLIDNRVCPVEKAVPAADGYSFPSGHTAGAASIWGGSAFLWWKNKIVRYLMILLVFLVAFSRNYVGVHTPQDVIVSMILGVFILFGVDLVLKFIDKKKNNDIVFYAFMMIFLTILYIYLSLKCSSQMLSYNSLVDVVNPLEMKHGVYPKLGLFAGIFSGWITERRFVDFSVPVSLKNKVISGLIGLGLLFLSSFVVRELFALIFAHQIASFLSAFFTAFFIVAIYPMILKCKKSEH